MNETAQQQPQLKLQTQLLKRKVSLKIGKKTIQVPYMVISVIGIALLGLVVLAFTRAAGPSAYIKLDTAISSGVSLVADSSGGGNNIKFGAQSSTGSGNLPAGVTLKEIDGGANYFDKWKHSFPSDPSFFPIGLWSENDSLADPAIINRYNDLGINVQVNPWASGGPNLTTAQLNSIRAGGQYVIPYAREYTFEATNRNNYGDTVAARTFGEEWDLGGAYKCNYGEQYLASNCYFLPGTTVVAGTSVQAMAQAVRDKDLDRPVYGNFTKGVAQPGGFGPSAAKDMDNRRAWANSVDILSFDIYPMTDYHTHYTRNSTGRVWWQGEFVKEARSLTNGTRPVWPFIETSQVFPHATNNSSWSRDYQPTPAEVDAQVWHALIAGARGIQYFNHNFNGTAGYPQSARVLLDSPWSNIAAQVKITNKRIKELAPVLNAPFVENLTTLSTGEVDVMTKLYNGHYYIFAATSGDGVQNMKLNIKGLGTKQAEVLYENRNATINNGVLSDTFSSPTSVHIYKVAL